MNGGSDPDIAISSTAPLSSRKFYYKSSRNELFHRYRYVARSRNAIINFGVSESHRCSLCIKCSWSREKLTPASRIIQRKSKLGGRVSGAAARIDRIESASREKLPTARHCERIIKPSRVITEQNRGKRQQGRQMQGRRSGKRERMRRTRGRKKRLMKNSTRRVNIELIGSPIRRVSQSMIHYDY